MPATRSGKKSNLSSSAAPGSGRTSRRASRSRSSACAWLVGRTIEALPLTQLPTRRQCLQRLFYLEAASMGVNSIQSIAYQVAKEALSLFAAATLSTIRIDKAAARITKLHARWAALAKHRSRDSATERKKRRELERHLDGMCDLTTATAEEDIKADRLRNEQDKRTDIRFLRDQRKQRKLHLANSDKTYMKRAAMKMTREAADSQIQEARKSENAAGESENNDQGVCSEEDSVSTDDDPEFVPATGRPSSSRLVQLHVPKRIVGAAVSSALDRDKVTDGAATYILSAVIQSGGGDLQKFRLSRSTVRRRRSSNRREQSEQVRAKFVPPGDTTIHWDGKLLEDSSGKAERLAVMVSGNTTQCKQGKILSARKIADGSGESQADEALQCIEEWQLRDTVRAMSFDTTASNTGSGKGAAVRLEKKMGKKLLYVPCRHHIQELAAKAVWLQLFGKDSTPETTLFKVFKSVWPKLDQTRYDILHIEDDELKSRAKTVLMDLNRLMQENHELRADYKESATLAIVALGGTMAQIGGASNIVFSRPGACHKARWMAHIIYGLKMLIFRAQLLAMEVISPENHSNLQRFAVFVCLFYVRDWLTCTSAADAAINDLLRYQDLTILRRLDPAVAQAAMRVYGRHTWYLCEELVPMALVSSKANPETKRRLASAVVQSERGQVLALGKPRLPAVPTDVSEIMSLKLEDFAGPASVAIFRALGIDVQFLAAPMPWDDDDDYNRLLSFVTHLLVTNDTAERGVKLVTDYINDLTTSEEERQQLLQVVEAHRQRYPDCRKATLAAQAAAGQCS